MFDKTQKFVEDTQYLCSIILSSEFYDADGFLHNEAMRRYEAYCETNEYDLTKEVNSAPMQTSFDDYKRLLNKVEIPDIDTFGLSCYIKENLSEDVSLREDAISIWETVVEQCGFLTSAVLTFPKAQHS